MYNKLQAKKILDNHQGDLEQLSVIQSSSSKLIVEAPAGFGKTYTMMSMIKYWLVTDQIKNYQHVLCLSFSVSAANRMKAGIETSQDFLTEDKYRIIATNFHGLCRQILKKYGYLVHLKDEHQLLKSIDIKKVNFFGSLEYNVQYFLKTFERLISDAEISVTQLLSLVEKYNKIILTRFVPEGFLSYHSIITLVLELFVKFPEVRKFYQIYFNTICVDEFQDTNILGLSLIKLLLGEKSRFVAFGDSMQQIYSFLGAIPNLIDKEIENPGIEYINLKTNYRFKTNRAMRLLDSDLREFRKNPTIGSKLPKATLKVVHGYDIENESEKILELIRSIKNDDPKSRIAILVSQNSRTTKCLLKLLEKKTSFFNALFADNDKNFVDFQNIAATLYQNNFEKHPITKNSIENYMKKVLSNVNHDGYTSTFIELLRTFLNVSISKYTGQFRSEFILEILSDHSLRQCLTDIKDTLVISTIHGSKGLEWDYVIIANFEQNELPNYYDIQDIGAFTNKNFFDFERQNMSSIGKLINKFYVAFTRAKKNVFVSYSDEHWSGGYNSQLTAAQISCISTLPFLKLIEM